MTRPQPLWCPERKLYYANAVAGAVAAQSRAAAAFDPATLSGIVLNYHAANSAKTYFSGSLVSQINDRSANAIHATTPGGSTEAPTDGARTLNGKAVLDFDGTKRMLCGSLGGLLTNTLHVFMVVIVDTYVSGDHFLEAGCLSDTDSGFRVLHSTSSNQAQFQVTNTVGPRSTLHSGAGNTMPIGSYFILEAYAVNTTEYGIRINGTETAGTPSTPMSSPEDPGIFARNTDVLNVMDGALAELIIYNVKKTGTDYTNIISYLETEWGL